MREGGREGERERGREGGKTSGNEVMVTNNGNDIHVPAMTTTHSYYAHAHVHTLPIAVVQQRNLHHKNWTCFMLHLLAQHFVHVHVCTLHMYIPSVTFGLRISLDYMYMYSVYVTDINVGGREGGMEGERNEGRERG